MHYFVKNITGNLNFGICRRRDYNSHSYIYTNDIPEKIKNILKLVSSINKNPNYSFIGRYKSDSNISLDINIPEHLCKHIFKDNIHTKLWDGPDGCESYYDCDIQEIVNEDENENMNEFRSCVFYMKYNKNKLEIISACFNYDKYHSYGYVEYKPSSFFRKKKFYWKKLDYSYKLLCETGYLYGKIQGYWKKEVNVKQLLSIKKTINFNNVLNPIQLNIPFLSNIDRILYCSVQLYREKSAEINSVFYKKWNKSNILEPLLTGMIIAYI